MKPIKGFEEFYSATANGEIWRHARSVRGHGTSMRTLKPRALVPVVRGNYLYVILCGDGIRASKAVHHFVCTAYHGEQPAPGMEVNHKDGNRMNNRPENLEWVTRSDNIAHSYNIGLRKSGERSHLAKLTGAQVTEIKTLLGAIPQARIAARFGVSATCISKIATGKKWKQITQTQGTS